MHFTQSCIARLSVGHESVPSVFELPVQPALWNRMVHVFRDASIRDPVSPESAVSYSK